MKTVFGVMLSFALAVIAGLIADSAAVAAVVFVLTCLALGGL